MSLLSINDGVFKVLATAGDNFGSRIWITSSNFTRRLALMSIANLCVLGKLKHKVEKAKHTLSRQQPTHLEIKSSKDSNNFSEALTRAKFEEINMDLFRKTISPSSKFSRMPTSGRILTRSSSSVVPLIFPRSNNSSRSTLVARSLPRVP